MPGHTDWVEDVLLSPHLRYLLVVLRKGTTRQQLESLQPDTIKLKATANDEDGGLVGATVTCRGTHISLLVISDCQCSSCNSARDALMVYQTAAADCFVLCDRWCRSRCTQSGILKIFRALDGLD